MVVKTHKPNHEPTKYSLTRKAGSSIIDYRPVFSPDEQSLVVIVENIARVYSVQTGDLVRTLEADTEIDELVGICFDQDGYNVYGCSKSGLLITWTWEKGAVLREFNLPHFGNRRVCSFDLIDSENCFITSVGPPNQEICLAAYSLKIGTLVKEYTNRRIPYYGSVRVAIGWCNGARFAAITNLSKFIYIQNLNRAHFQAFHSSFNEFRLLDVAAHPTEPAIAVVDTLGRAMVIRGNLFHYQQVAKEVLHWHFLPPFAVRFSPSGGYLITGGMEKVLVKWSLGNFSNKPNAKEFIPRLPGIIKYIAVSHSNIAVTLSNNSVVIANAQMRVHCTILECGGLSPAVRATGSLVYHKQTGCLFMGGRPGHLQMYSTTTDKVLFNLDITQMNSIPAESKHNLIPLETEVTCAAMSSLGAWLVTSEYRHDGVLYPEERLKFWASSQGFKNSVPFRMATCVNLSHGGYKVVAITLNDQGTFCVTAGLDQKIRIWKSEPVIRYGKQKSGWCCLTACYYSSGNAQFQTSSAYNDMKMFDTKNLIDKIELPYMKTVGGKDDLVLKVMNMHKEPTLVNVEAENVDPELKMGGVAISQDGSLIAAWFGCKLTLWDTHLCNLRTTLSHPALRPKGLHVHFGTGDAAHYLVCTTENCLAVFSLLSLTVKWLVQIRPTCLVADMFSNKMAVVTDQNDVIIFSPHSSAPIVRQDRVLNPATGVINVCTFVPCQRNHEVRLYLMRNDSEIYCLEPERSKTDQLEMISHKNLPRSNFGALLAEQQVSEVAPSQPGELDELNADALRNGAIHQFLSAAPHMIPPVSLICTEFLEHISGQQNPEEPDEETTEAMNIDAQSSDDETEIKEKVQDSTKTQLWAPDYKGVKEKRLKSVLKMPTLSGDAAASIFGLSE